MASYRHVDFSNFFFNRDRHDALRAMAHATHRQTLLNGRNQRIIFASMDPEEITPNKTPELQDLVLPHKSRTTPIVPLHPLLTDRAMRSVIQMVVRPNECDQNYCSGWAVRNWYERNLQERRVITKAYQEDVAFLLKVLDGEVDADDLIRLKKLKKQLGATSV